jgi:hypothetical protein
MRTFTQTAFQTGQNFDGGVERWFLGFGAFTRPSGKIIGDYDVDARHDGLFGSWRPPYAAKRQKKQACA